MTDTKFDFYAKKKDDHEDVTTRTPPMHMPPLKNREKVHRRNSKS